MAVTRRKPTDQPDYSQQSAASAAGYAVPREDYGGLPREAQLTHMLSIDPNFPIDPGYHVIDTGNGKVVVKDNNPFMNFMDSNAAMIGIPAGIASLGLLGGIGGGAPAASSAPSMPGVVSGIPKGIGFGATNPAPAAAGGIGSTLGKFFGKIDPTSLILGGLSLFGSDPTPFQHRDPYTGAAAPQQTLETLLGAIKNLSSTVAQHGAPSMPSAIVQQGPAPVSIPGIPFQIGGGLGTDPALKNMDLTKGQNPPPSPFASSTATNPSPAQRKRQ